MEEAPKSALDRWMRDNDRDDAAVAEAVAVSRSQVTRLRNGTSKPSNRTALALERLTGIPAWDFVRPAEQDAAA